jgi:hypothetical protein
MSAPLLHPDGLKRCPWPKQDPLYVAYHDEEWGVPEYDDRALYEKLILDGFQAGLSWITILRKRQNFRRAFDGFEPAKIARYTPKKIGAAGGIAAGATWPRSRRMPRAISSTFSGVSRYRGSDSSKSWAAR